MQALAILLLGIIIRPFKPRHFWTAVIVYTEMVVIVKYIFQVRIEQRSIRVESAFCLAVFMYFETWAWPTGLSLPAPRSSPPLS